MITVLRFLFHEPILGGTVLFCLCIIGSLILSGRAEKRRTRELLKLREASRPSKLASTPADVAVTADNRANDRPHRPFRLFRWEFALVSAVLVAFVIPKMNEAAKVDAKAPVSDTSAGSAAISSGSDSSEGTIVAESSNPLPEVSTNQNLAAHSGGGGAASKNSLFNFDSEAEWEGVAEASRNEMRGDLGFRSGNEFRETTRRGPFSRR